LYCYLSLVEMEKSITIKIEYILIYTVEPDNCAVAVRVSALDLSPAQ
jgi:hypothetical protein